MNLLELKKHAVELYASGTALHMVGPPGVGKSEVTHTIRDILSAHFSEKFGYHDVLLPTVDSPDIRGFQMPTKGADGKPYSFYTRSALLPSREYLDAHPKGIYVIDERNSADQLTLKAIAPSVLWKRFGDEYLPPDWWVVSASNRVSDRSGANRAPRMLVNRERTMQIEPHVTSWAVWAEERSIHPMLIAFAKQHPGVVFSPEVPNNDDPFCTPRSFVSAAKLLALAAGVDSAGNPNMVIPNTGVVMQMVEGDIGPPACAELFAFLKVADELPTIEEILKDPKGCKAPKELSAAYAGVQMCIHFAQPGNIDKLWTYAERMPKELQVSAAKSLVEKGAGVLLNSPALNKWIMANKALINATNATR